MIETFKLLVLSAARYNIFEWNTHVFSSTTLGFWLGRHQVECEFSRPCTVLLLTVFHSSNILYLAADKTKSLKVSIIESYSLHKYLSMYVLAIVATPFNLQL